jgi:signal transduction histidine kinase
VLQLRRERALARLRSDFISGVSHELRTPLTQIQMFAQTLLLDRVRGDDERRRSLAIIDQETRRLAHLVENILQFSRGERGTLRITRAPHDLGRLVRETADAFAPIARARSVSVEVDAEESMVDVDEEAVRQIVLNLLDNAVKYGPPRQRVLVGVHGREISVDDEGPGIPPREREAVFERYKRLDRERGRAIAGMGIGLSVVRELVELHGGRVRVEEGARGGARFVVAL